MWNKRKPNIKMLQLFGCKAYAKVLKPVKKLDKRSKRYVFVGYASNVYRLWDSDKQKIKIAKDVKFTNKIKETRQKEGGRRINLLTDEDEEQKEKCIQQAREEQGDEKDFIDNGKIKNTEEDEKRVQTEQNKVRRSGRKRKQSQKYTDSAMLTYREALAKDDRHN